MKSLETQFRTLSKFLQKYDTPQLNLLSKYKVKNIKNKVIFYDKKHLSFYYVGYVFKFKLNLLTAENYDYKYRIDYQGDLKSFFELTKDNLNWIGTEKILNTFKIKGLKLL